MYHQARNLARKTWINNLSEDVLSCWKEIDKEVIKAEKYVVKLREKRDLLAGQMKTLGLDVEELSRKRMEEENEAGSKAMVLKPKVINGVIQAMEIPCNLMAPV